MPPSTLARAAVLLLACATACAEDATVFKPGFQYTGEVFADVHGGIERGAVYTGLAHAQLDFDLAPWKAQLDLYAPHGDSATARRVGDFSVLSNIDGVHQVRVHDAWLERALGGGSLRAGLVAADDEFWGSANAMLFVSSAFGAPSVVSGNLPQPPIFPQGLLGARFAYALDATRTLRVEVLDGDGGDLARDNRHGLDVDLGQGALAVAELEQVDDPNAPERGHWRLGAFYHSGVFADPAGPARRGVLGAVATLDHALTERASAFVRGGAASRGQTLVPWSIECGVERRSLIGASDTAGLGVAYVALDPRLAESALGARHRREAIVEATLSYPLLPRMVLQPDLQYIIDPSGDARARNALVVGLRASLAFDE